MGRPWASMMFDRRRISGKPRADLQGTKAPREAEQVLRGQVLMAENDDGMRVIRRLDGMKRRRVQILRKIDTDDFGPERGTAWANGQTGSTTHQYRSSQEAWR
jgi:hypothetical protein